ncbi:tRNA (adenosine(37)-N6)-threonylcarbamoyltransferase complex dimerization subunit type 1 TsaB [Syntrophomonas palmitatica]|uniref:tRNA (adenosine(37)-N6)-threonylcarbamoyltransferase complex dimerization subunit type 1 TsaB n=1 Tax=Syntrophomonas palmitatica TaxID=402877 RepID=UPI0006D1EDB4|nr:tRNA (adenosine(37)-N6)-threonylcarbamoyltransferase complex dimerization subunit type 1 TsaB [Syntrophomonas palmitatica]
MQVLAIDSATPVAGVALLDNGILIREEFSNYKKNHSETLMPMVDQVLHETDRKLQDITALAVTIGPGSFTGLRIGLALVKGLALAARIPVVGISTLEVLAHNICESNALICPLLDARKNEVYCGFYTSESGGGPRRLLKDAACSPQEFIEKALEVTEKNGLQTITLLGEGFYPYAEAFGQGLGEKMRLAGAHLMLPRASALADLAVKRVIQGDFDNPLGLKPYYIRLSEAEYRLGRGEL